MRAFGRYRLLEQIGSGGMAEVWRAEALGPEGFVKEVALKLIRGDHEARPDWVRMFVREAHLASRLTHANVVQVFDFGEVEGRHYIAMELVRGRTLREVVHRCRAKGLRLGVARAVHVCAEVARGLAYAHRYEDGGRPSGLVHRDVSPQNVLLSFEGEVKLTDFGIARALGAAEATAPGTVKGKAAYMAPEQARGEAVDGRADVFALGVILWELCAGRRLFARDSDAASLSALLSAAPPSAPSAWNEEVPPELDALALAALERDPALRTASAEELAAGLAAIRVRMAAAREDDLHLDLRAFMRRLWPDGEARDLARRPTDEGTVRRTLVRDPGRPAGAGGLGDDSVAGGVTPSTLTLEARRTRKETGGRRLVLRGPVARRLTAVASVIGACALALLAARAVQKTAARAEAHTPLVREPAEPTGVKVHAGARAPPPTAADALLVPPPAIGEQGSATGERTPPDGRILEVSSLLGSLQVPHPETGQGILAVMAEPFGAVLVDEKACGETPLELRLTAGVYRVRVAHKKLGKRETSIRVQPGKRSAWTADLRHRQYAD